MFSKYERRNDTRDYGEKKDLFEGVSPSYLFTTLQTSMFKNFLDDMSIFATFTIKYCVILDEKYFV